MNLPTTEYFYFIGLAAERQPVSFIELLVLGLATWRITSLLVNEDGPWDLLTKFRLKTGVYYDEHSVPQGRNLFARMLLCVWCLSPWIGLVITVLWILLPRPTLIASFPFALSALAILIERAVGNG